MSAHHRPLRFHAIYVALDDVELFRASVASIYQHVDGITVITTHDRDWMGTARPPTGIAATVLGRELDPDRKIDLIVCAETNEARARNRAMDYAAPRARSWRVRRQHDRDLPMEVPDYFLIVDADEIYEAAALERLKRYVAATGKRFYRVPCIRYFKRWNYRVDGFEWAVSIVRSDCRLPYLRMRKIAKWRRAIARLPLAPAWCADAFRGYVDVPASVGSFHHGSYVGPRRRIEEKLDSFGHASEIPDGWLEQRVRRVDN